MHREVVYIIPKKKPLTSMAESITLYMRNPLGGLSRNYLLVCTSVMDYFEIFSMHAVLQAYEKVGMARDGEQALI